MCCIEKDISGNIDLYIFLHDFSSRDVQTRFFVKHWSITFYYFWGKHASSVCYIFSIYVLIWHWSTIIIRHPLILKVKLIHIYILKGPYNGLHPRHSRIHYGSWMYTSSPKQFWKNRIYVCIYHRNTNRQHLGPLVAHFGSNSETKSSSESASRTKDARSQPATSQTVHFPLPTDEAVVHYWLLCTRGEPRKGDLDQATCARRYGASHGFAHYERHGQDVLCRAHHR